VSSNVRKVTVLLATYNGVSFLDEQLASLSEQQNVKVEVMVNDDGSTDGTIEILEYWRAKGLIVSISQSKGLGATQAFLTLLQSCGQKDFVAFCDQDDIWESRKLISQIQRISTDSPQMVFSRREYIDEQNQRIGISPKIRREVSFRNALVENPAPGNTQMLNNQAVRIVNRLQNSNVEHYDSWIYLTINALGECKYIDRSLVQYRIHDNNSVGIRRYDIVRILRSPDHYYNQALNFKNAMASAKLNNKLDDVEKFLKFVEEPKRLRRLFQSFYTGIYRQRKLDDFILKCILIIRVPQAIN
jgi:glycosyltransferase involved in cell wall biosynthesis